MPQALGYDWLAGQAKSCAVTSGGVIFSARMPYTHRHQPMICIFTFYTLGLVELSTMSQKIQNKRILILTPQTILCVKVMPDFKAVVVSSGSVFSHVWCCEFGL
jgi:hypothetical protein